MKPALPLLLVLASCAGGRPAATSLEPAKQALAARDGGTVEGARLEVEGHLGAGDLPALLPALSDKVRQHPGDAVAAYELGLALFVLGKDRREEGLDHLTRAAELAPTEPEFALRLGAGLLETGQLDRARTQVDRALELAPRSIEARLLLASCLLQQGAADRAVEALSGLLDLSPKPADLARATRIVKKARDPMAGLAPPLLDEVKRAMGQAGSGDEDAALQSFETLAERAPDEAVVQELLGLARQRAGDSRGAVAALRRAIEQGPRRPQGRRYLADLYHDLGEHQLAARLYAEVVERDPFDDGARSRLASYDLARGDAPGAVAQLRNVALLAPGDPGVLLRLSRARMAAGDPAGAERDLLEATSSESPGVEPFRELGEFLLARREVPGADRQALSRRAQEAFEKALVQKPGDPACVKGLAASRTP